MNYINFLREVGQKITINKMITFDSIKSRLDREQPLSFLEFNYMLLQAYDFLYLNKEFNCILQLGGSDQWGNIVTGIDLIKKITNYQTFAITSPLITNSDGSKMGKTANGAIWLDKDKLDDFYFYQFWRNVNDQDVSKFLRLFTTLPLLEINKLSKLKNKEINEAKKILSYEVTKLCRGKKIADKVHDISQNIFDNKIIDKRIKSIEVKLYDLLNNKFNLIDALESLNLVKSRSDAKRIIKSRGVKINDLTFENKQFFLNQYVNNDKEIKISVGRKKIGIIKIKQNL